ATASAASICSIRDAMNCLDVRGRSSSWSPEPATCPDRSAASDHSHMAQPRPVQLMISMPNSTLARSLNQARSSGVSSFSCFNLSDDDSPSNHKPAWLKNFMNVICSMAQPRSFGFASYAKSPYTRSSLAFNTYRMVVLGAYP